MAALRTCAIIYHISSVTELYNVLTCTQIQAGAPLRTRIFKYSAFFFHFNTLLPVKLLENFIARERNGSYFKHDIKDILKNRFSIILFTRLQVLKKLYSNIISKRIVVCSERV